MNTDVALYWLQESLKTAVILLAPLLGTALVVGVLISLLQAVTSIHEMTLSFIPKVLAVSLVLLLLAPWMLQMLMDYTTHVMNYIPSISH